jgi:hypothetical protein
MIHKILSCGLPLHAIFYSLLMPVSSMIRKMPVSSMIQIKFSYFPCQNLKTHDAVAADSWAWAPGPEPEIFRNLWSWTLEPETCGPELWHLKPVDPSSGTWNLRTWALEPETCGPELWNLQPVDLSSGTWNLWTWALESETSGPELWNLKTVCEIFRHLWYVRKFWQIPNCCYCTCALAFTVQFKSAHCRVKLARIVNKLFPYSWMSSFSLVR